MISNRDIILISSIDWDDQWQAPQEIASRLSKAGNRVLYLENTGIRTPAFRDSRRIVRRLKHWTSALGERSIRTVLPQLWVHAPLVLPPFGSTFRRSLNRHILLRLVHRVVRDLGLHDPLIWVFLPTDTSLALLDKMSSPKGRIIYYRAADFAHLTTSVQKLERNETELLKRSDVVFAICEKLAAGCRPWNQNVHVFPYGVNLKAFALGNSVSGRAGERFSWSKESGNNGRTSHKVIGYVGGLHRHVDIDLLISMARARADWSWVFVGACEIPLKGLVELPNVYVLGQRAHSDLKHYISSFDVCIVPYRRSAYTATVVPSKINEYLAMGKPVVCTDLPPVCDFNDKHQILITAEGRTDNFLEAIDDALNIRDDVTLISRRREVARQADWMQRLEAMSELIMSERQIKERRVTTSVSVATNNEIEVTA
jgi:glycosyltransferase involved in cell wall biosynthesis